MIEVVNAVGTSDEKCPSGYNSWLDYWNRMTGKSAAYCRHCHERTSDLCGGHVQKVEQRSDDKWYRLPVLYITPICYKCNNPENSKIFNVDEKDLVRVP
jgi:hypothetical protein